MISFHSTRGIAPETDLSGIALEGLAPDGGLYLPKMWPVFSSGEIQSMRGARYQDIAFPILNAFMSEAIPSNVLRALVEKAYADFENPQITPLRKLGDDLHVLELFHGPTLAFKDVALQLLGHVFEYLLAQSDQRMTIVGATSGDTGSAAIAALANRRNIDVFILYPNKGPSDIQRKQMTCVDASNVYAIAIDGTFDDCQALVKNLFAQQDLRAKWNLSTVNSINLVRILAQIVYYFYAASRLDVAPTFVVPTGNFGDIYAGYAAMKCGLPMNKLVVASNSNDILTRFFATGTMQPKGVSRTISPSMDIQVSSNFERLLFDMVGGDAASLCALMDDLKTKGSFTVPPPAFALAKKFFAAGSANDPETLATIKDIYSKTHDVLDPHTAVGVKVAQDLQKDLAPPIVCLATAHPAKFPDALTKALGFAPEVPAKTAALISKPERTTLVPMDMRHIVTFINERRKEA